MNAQFTTAQEDRIREIVGEMFASFTAGATDRIREEICSTLASAMTLADRRRADRAAISDDVAVQHVHGEGHK